MRSGWRGGSSLCVPSHRNWHEHRVRGSCAARRVRAGPVAATSSGQFPSVARDVCRCAISCVRVCRARLLRRRTHTAGRVSGLAHAVTMTHSATNRHAICLPAAALRCTQLRIPHSWRHTTSLHRCVEPGPPRDAKAPVVGGTNGANCHNRCGMSEYEPPATGMEVRRR